MPGTQTFICRHFNEQLRNEFGLLIAQLEKNLPSMKKTLVQFLSWENPLEKGKATHSSILGFPRWLSW